jgi:hypothetical protein
MANTKVTKEEMLEALDGLANAKSDEELIQKIDEMDGDVAWEIFMAALKCL